MKNWRIIVFIGILAGLGFSISAEAQESSNANYSVKPILPENQRDTGRSFFDLRVNPGGKQTIQIQINNFSNEEQTYHIKVNTAQTNGNVVIDYGQDTLPEEHIINYPISEFVDYPEEVTIPAQKAGLVSLDIHAPATSFDGILLGGIQVKKDFTKEQEENPGQIFSEYAYVIGLMLSENDTEVTPELKLNEVKSEVITNNAGLVAVLENPQPINIKGVEIEADIRAKGSEEPVMTRMIENGGIAPQSVFAMNIFHGEAGNTKPLEAGDYQLSMKATDEEGREWLFTEEFSITKEQAMAVNREVFTVEDHTNPWLYAIIGILAALVVVGGGYSFYRIRKNRRT